VALGRKTTCNLDISYFAMRYFQSSLHSCCYTCQRKTGVTKTRNYKPTVFVWNWSHASCLCLAFVLQPACVQFTSWKLKLIIHTAFIQSSSNIVYLVDDRWNTQKILKSDNRWLSQWLHLTTTTTIQFVSLFIFKFCIPSGVKITTALISMRQAKPEGFWNLQ